MNNLHSIWSKRFNHYINEVQKYMRFVFTGHLALVFVFVIGAIGYQYSEWLKVAPKDFPAEWLVAIIIGIIVGLSRTTSLLREPDEVYLLPLESKMSIYFQKALNWTFWSQIFLPLGVYIVGIPLLNTVTDLSTRQIWFGIILIILLKYFNVQIEFKYRYINRGNNISIDRVVRILLSIIAIWTLLTSSFYMSLIYIVLFLAYNSALTKRITKQPIPYEHFVKLEQNRMMGFYRFANYFTDVPHLKGSIRRRKYLDVLYKLIPFSKENTQAYLVFRTFIRTDDHFYLWFRLTAISAVVAFFVNIPIVTWIVSGALAFASTIQLKYALLSSVDFRMDLLYPIEASQRKRAVQKLLRIFMIGQAIIVMACSIEQSLFFIVGVIIFVMSELTFNLSKDPKPLV